MLATASAKKMGTDPIFLERDPIGERSLYYAQAGDRLVHAPRLQDVLASGLVARELNLPAVATYLAWGYLPGRETLVRGVYKVLPGERVRFTDGRLTREFYWSLPPEPASYDDEDTLRRALRERLETAVRRCLPAGEPVGASLSGGIDSSLVVALAARLHDAPLHTYSVAFGAEYANELEFSSLVAKHCGTRHHVVEISASAVLRDLDRTIALLGDPIGDPLTVPNALVFAAAAGDTRVVLNGEGGDPCFGGPKNVPMVLAELFGDLYSADARRHRAASYLRAHQKCYDDLPQMLAPEVLAAIPEGTLEDWVTPYLEDPRWRSYLARLMAINVRCKGAHHILAKVEALSAPFGVRPRAPLFDHDVVELAFAVPPQLKLRGTVEKYLLKEAVRDLLPQAILERPKSGMLVPVHGWFRGPLLPLARERLLDGLAPWGMFRRSWLEQLLDGRLPGIRTRRGVKIWLLVTLEAWLRGVLKLQSSHGE